MDYPAGANQEEVFAMSERDEEKNRVKDTAAWGSTHEQAGDPCAHIKDPVRRGLCRVCQLPVVGEAPFCKDYEAPAP
jgi:hypothetical protein